MTRPQDSDSLKVGYKLEMVGSEDDTACDGQKELPKPAFDARSELHDSVSTAQNQVLPAKAQPFMTLILNHVIKPQPKTSI